MKAEEILRSPWLDILFENRNKEYGAYTLRKSYDQRIVIATGSALLFGLVIVLLSQFLKTNRNAAALVYTDYELTEAQMHKPEPPKLPEPVKKTPPPVRSVNYVVPVFVKDRVAPMIVSPDDDPDAAVSNITNPNGPTVGVIQPQIIPVTTTTTVKQPEKQPDPVVEDVVVTFAEEMPAYPGGRDKMVSFLQDKLQDYVTEEGKPKKATVRFIVEKDGTLTGIEIIGGDDNDFNKRVQHTIERMPKWKPGVQNGHKVKVLYEFPIQLVPAED
jgi:periplasmic protein TonB